MMHAACNNFSAIRLQRGILLIGLHGVSLSQYTLLATFKIFMKEVNSNLSFVCSGR